MQGSAQALSNYRVANAQARQQALDNQMSLYAGPNAALAGISGGQGANLSQAGVSPFTAGYFNIGRATPHLRSNGEIYNGMSTDAAGDVNSTDWRSTGHIGLDQYRDGPPVISAQFNPGRVDMSQNGAPQQPPPPQQNPFQFRPGGRQ
jgi:hypothetical protein